MFLKPFHEEIKLNESGRSSGNVELQNPPTGIKAIKVDDETESSNGRRLHAEVGCGSCHCCDYILLKREGEKGKRIHFIEISNLRKKESDLHKKYGDVEQKYRDEIVREEIIREQVLKVYGSLVVFLRLPIISKADWRRIPPQERDIKKEKKAICGKEAVFCFVISDLKTLEDTQAFDYLESRLTANSLPSFISEVRVIGKEEFIEKYRQSG